MKENHLMGNGSIDFVMGKGGVGRSTASRILAHHYAERGESSIIVECNGCADLPAVYDKESEGYTPIELTTNIWTISISPMAAIEDYVVQQLKMRKLYSLIFDNRLVAPLIEAAPGLHDAVQLGKIYDLQISGQWDHIVVDCPATGHGISLISAAKTMMDLSRHGPLYSQSRLVEDVVSAHGRVLFVTLPEELPTRETLQLWQTMRPDFHQKVMGILVNQWQPISSTLHEALGDSDTLQALEAHPAYQSVLHLIQEQHRQQESWLKWLRSNLCAPHHLSVLTCDKWSGVPSAPTVNGLEDWL